MKVLPVISGSEEAGKRAGIGEGEGLLTVKIEIKKKKIVGAPGRFSLLSL